MDPKDSLALVRALEEQQATGHRRVLWSAWASVLLAAIVFALLVASARRELNGLNAEIAGKQQDLTQRQAELATAEKQLAQTRADLQRTIVDLDSGRFESARDNAERARSAAEPVRATSSKAGAAPDRRTSIAQLFDANPAVRVSAYGALLPRYRDDRTLIPELIAMARADAQNVNGIYNTLVVLSHMDADTLRLETGFVKAFAEEQRGKGPKVSARADVLLKRLQP